jgi:hypothetical protein
MLNLFQHPFRRLRCPSRKWTLKQVQGDEIAIHRKIFAIGRFTAMVAHNPFAGASP